MGYILTTVILYKDEKLKTQMCKTETQEQTAIHKLNRET